MTITKNNFMILRAAALQAAENNTQIFKAIQETETAAEIASKKTSLYILEKRKTNKNYCR